MGRCCQLFASRTKDASGTLSPQEQGLEGIGDMMLAYRKIADLSLPPHVALALAPLHRDISNLERLISEANFSNSQLWKLPVSEEQVEWQRMHVNGGALLRRKLCTASIDTDTDCFLGNLFVSDSGLAFDSGTSGDDGSSFGTGFVYWAKITSINILHVTETHVEVLSAEGAADWSKIRFELTDRSDGEFLQEVWKLNSCSQSDAGHVFEESQLSKVIDDVKQTQDVPNQKNDKEGAPILLSQLASSTSPKAHRALTLDSKVSGFFNEAPEQRKPFQVPQKEQPVGIETLPQQTLGQIKETLESKGFLSRFIRDAKQAHDIAMGPWCESKKSPGVMVRKTTFTLPVPQDFPKAVTRLVNLPSETKVTAIYRLCQEADVLVFTVQFCSHDIPFGENFRVHETVQFKPDSANGVEATKWVEVMWVAALPWTHGVLKAIIESKSKADGLGNHLVADLKKSCA